MPSHGLLAVSGSTIRRCLVKYVPLTMVREQMDGIPSVACPAAYLLRTFRNGDERAWARIEAAVGEFPSPSRALEHFEEEFGPVRDQLADRCLVLEDGRGNPIGTATAWYGNLDGEPRGRVHWVAIVPEHQGKGLAKPLLRAVMERLARDHPQAYLTTQTTSYRAVNLYLQFGFVPYPTNEQDREGWAIVERALGRAIL